MAITDYHRLIFEYLEEYRTTHPDQNFTYLLRSKESAKRPRTEYLFTGDEVRYIMVGLCSPNNGRNKTRSIGLYFEYDSENDSIKQVSLALNFDDPKFEPNVPVYEEIILRIGLENFSQETNNRYYYDYKDLSWKESINKYLTEHRPIINEVIKEFGRESAFFITSETLDADIEYLRQNTTNQSWKYSAQNSDDWEWIYDNQTIGLNYNNSNIQDLAQFKSVLELETHLDVVGKRLTYLTHLMNFKDARNGEVVLASPTRTTIGAIGIFLGPYKYNKSGHFEHSRSVEWLATKPWEYVDHSIKDYAIPFANDPFCSAAIGREIIEEYVKTYPEYRQIFEEKGILKTTTNMGETPAPSQKSTTSFPKNTILYGPPGTGKTYTTIDKAVQLIDGQKSPDHRINKKRFDALLGSQIEFITFHQNYTFEDFVMGIKPDLEDSGTSLRFSRHEGVFYRLAKRSQEKYEASLSGKEPPKNYVLIIDEINRANMSRVFGELITLLEEDKRLGAENELKVVLPSGEQFAVPPNLYIIGTMNTADKSLALLDIALRRRFEFEGMYPQYELPGMDKETGDILKNLNNAIHEQKKSADFLIGHAYFLNKKRGELSGVFEKRVIPLLMEYFSGRTEMAREVLQKAGIKTKLCDFSYQLLVDDDTL